MAAASGGDVPAARAAMAVNELIHARDGLSKLRTFLMQLDEQRAASAQREIDGVLTRLSTAISALGVSDAAGRSPAAAAGFSDGMMMPQQSVSSCRNKRTKQSSGRRSQHPSDKKITATLEDGHVWRKYGQKDIQDSPYPRSYYRCTHKSDQGCAARRQVQRCQTDTSKYVVTYYGEHTCRDLSTIPLIIDQATAAAAARAAEPDDGDERANNNLMISFGPGGNVVVDGAASSSRYLQADQQQLSTSWCTSGDDMFSSSAGSFMQMDELISAVVGSAGPGVVSAASAAAPDRGGVLGGMASGGGGGRGTGTASFPPSSPNSLGFAVGSLGSIGGGEDDDDDDMFRLDP